MNPQMSDQEKMTNVMKGLRSQMLERVLVLEPKNCEDLLTKLRGIEEAAFLSTQRPEYNCLLVRKDKEEKESMQAVVASGCTPAPNAEVSKLDKLCQLMEEMLLRQSSGYQQPRARPQNDYYRTIDGKPLCRYCRYPGHFYRNCPRRQNQNSSTTESTEPTAQQSGN